MKCKFRDGGLCFNSGSRHYNDGCIECECIMPISNADHIRSMTDEELGLFLGEWADRHLCWMCDGTGEVLYWLKQPYKEDT